MPSQTQILKTYFGLKPGQTLREFIKEVKTLSELEANELAQLAAAELGIVAGGSSNTEVAA